MNLDTLIGYLTPPPSSIFITSHTNGDPDGVCSAAALASFLARILPVKEIQLVFDGITELSQKIATYYGIEYTEAPPKTPDVWIIVDAQNPKQLGKMYEHLINHPRVIAIDHHEVSHLENTENIFRICNTISSTGELVASLLTKSSYEITPQEASLLLCAILYDTKRFIFIGSETLEIAASLNKMNANYQVVVNLLEEKMSRSERIARFKAASRATLYPYKGWLIVSAEVSAFEASAARALIMLGADVAIVLAERAKDIRISVRTTKQFHKLTGIHAGKDLLFTVTEMIAGTAGGHPTAAGANGIRHGKEAVNRLISLLKEKILLQNPE